MSALLWKVQYFEIHITLPEMYILWRQKRSFQFRTNTFKNKKYVEYEYLSVFNSKMSSMLHSRRHLTTLLDFIWTYTYPHIFWKYDFLMASRSNSDEHVMDYNWTKSS